MEKPLFYVKFSVNELNRNAKKYDKEGKVEKVEGPKNAIQKSNKMLQEHTLKMQSTRRTKQLVS